MLPFEPPRYRRRRPLPRQAQPGIRNAELSSLPERKACRTSSTGPQVLGITLTPEARSKVSRGRETAPHTMTCQSSWTIHLARARNSVFSRRTSLRFVSCASWTSMTRNRRATSRTGEILPSWMGAAIRIATLESNVCATPPRRARIAIFAGHPERPGGTGSSYNRSICTKHGCSTCKLHDRGQDKRVTRFDRTGGQESRSVRGDASAVRRKREAHGGRRLKSAIGTTRHRSSVERGAAAGRAKTTPFRP